jgi:NADPH2:quinone reductase
MRARHAAAKVSLRQTAVGLNFLDIYERSGLYPVPALPGWGRAWGVVETVGPACVISSGRSRGVRVVAASALPERVVPVNRLVAIPRRQRPPPHLTQGTDGQFLLRQTHRVRKGDAVVILAAAGGVGSIAGNGRDISARRSSLSSAAKRGETGAASARSTCCCNTSLPGPRRVRELTDGKGACRPIRPRDVRASLDCLRPWTRELRQCFRSGAPLTVLELSRRALCI